MSKETTPPKKKMTEQQRKNLTSHDRTKPRGKPKPPPSIDNPYFIGEKTGRPATYRPEFDQWVERLRFAGNTREQCATIFGVAPATIDRWGEFHPSFREAYARGGEEADNEIRQALYHRARGAKVWKQVPVKIKTGQFEERVEIVEVEEHLAPDFASASLWLANRDRSFSLKPGFEPVRPETPDPEADTPALRIVGGLPDE